MHRRVWGPVAVIVALFVAGLVYHAVQRRQLKARWGDVRYGVLVLIARAALDALSRRKPDARSWNPNVLVLAGSPKSRWHLVIIGRALAGPNGLLTIASVGYIFDDKFRRIFYSQPFPN